MAYKCTLSLEDNPCPCLADDGEHCADTNNQCSFRESPSKSRSNEIQRQGKWFEIT